VILIDTNALIYYLHRVEPYAKKVKTFLIEHRDLAVTLRVVDEVIFTMVRLEAWRKLGIRRLDHLRDYIRKYGFAIFDDAINDLYQLINMLGITVLEDRGRFEEFLLTTKQYSLLPGDALIAISAKHYGIDTILTFDDDFRKVPWLKVVP